MNMSDIMEEINGGYLMARYRMACALSVLAIALGVSTCFVMPTAVFAEGEQAQSGEPVMVTTADELNDALYYGGNYKLGADINTSECQWGTPVYAMHDTVLDLDKYTITLPDANASIYSSEVLKLFKIL